MSKTICETCDAIYTVSKKPYLAPPSTETEWLEMSKQFEEFWNMPHAIGCIETERNRKLQLQSIMLMTI